MHPDEDAPSGAVALAESRKAKRNLQQQIRRSNALVKSAIDLAKGPPGERKCNGKVKLKDDAGNPLTDPETGKWLYRPCDAPPIKGGTVCWQHGGKRKAVQRNADRRMLALVEPAMVRLETLIQQDVHLPTSLGAIRTVLERAGEKSIGVLKDTSVQDTRPIINIGIAVGGIAQKPEVKVGILSGKPAAKEGEVVGDDRDPS